MNSDYELPDLDPSEYRKFNMWQIIYAISAFAGGIYIGYRALSDKHPYQLQAFSASAICLLLGVLILRRSRYALYLYLGLGIHMLVSGVYRMFTSGYHSDDLGLFIAPVIMVVTLSALLDALKPYRP